MAMEWGFPPGQEEGTGGRTAWLLQTLTMYIELKILLSQPPECRNYTPKSREEMSCRTRGCRGHPEASPLVKEMEVATPFLSASLAGASGQRWGGASGSGCLIVGDPPPLIERVNVWSL